jgi:hypothetical protein
VSVPNSLLRGDRELDQVLQWESHPTLLRSVGAIGALSANVSGVRPFNDAWQRTLL